jgi:hypothetical protein
MAAACRPSARVRSWPFRRGRRRTGGRGLRVITRQLSWGASAGPPPAAREHPRSPAARASIRDPRPVNRSVASGPFARTRSRPGTGPAPARQTARHRPGHCQDGPAPARHRPRHRRAGPASARHHGPASASWPRGRPGNRPGNRPGKAARHSRARAKSERIRSERGHPAAPTRPTLPTLPTLPHAGVGGAPRRGARHCADRYQASAPSGDPETSAGPPRRRSARRSGVHLDAAASTRARRDGAHLDAAASTRATSTQTRRRAPRYGEHQAHRDDARLDAAGDEHEGCRDDAHRDGAASTRATSTRRRARGLPRRRPSRRRGGEHEDAVRRRPPRRGGEHRDGAAITLDDAASTSTRQRIRRPPQRGSVHRDAASWGRR